MCDNECSVRGRYSLPSGACSRSRCPAVSAEGGLATAIENMWSELREVHRRRPERSTPIGCVPQIEPDTRRRRSARRSAAPRHKADKSRDVQTTPRLGGRAKTADRLSAARVRPERELVLDGESPTPCTGAARSMATRVHPHGRTVRDNRPLQTVRRRGRISAGSMRNARSSPCR